MSGEHPTVGALVKLGDIVVGSIMIHPDGTFSGKFDSPSLIHTSLVQMLAAGLADSVRIEPNLEPAKRKTDV